MDYRAKTDWNYNDTVTEQDMNRIEAGLGDLHERLDTELRQEIVLQPGMQTITTKRDTPFRLSGLTGRMLLNLEARTWGQNKSLSGLAGFQSTITLDNNKSVVGGGSVKITATTANTIADAVSTKPYSLKAGKKYVAVGHIYNESAKSVLLALQGTAVSTPFFTDKGKWVTVFMKYAPSVDVSSTQIVARLNAAASGNVAYADGLRMYEISDTEYTALDKMTTEQVAMKYPYTEGFAGIRNPYAIRWTSVAQKEVAAFLAFDTELIASPVIANETDCDTLFVGSDRQYYKNTVWRKRTLSGDLNWIISASLSGFKEIKIVGYESYSPGAVIPMKFDGSIMPNTVSNKADVASFDSTGTLYLTISSTDSGWADGYSPTTDELKAYMYGWKMYDGSTNANDGLGVYSRTDGLNKRWTPLASFNGRDYSGNVSTVPLGRPELLISGGYRISRPTTDYMIIYHLSTPAIECLTFEGQLSFIEGDNTIEIGSGIVLRERANPYRDQVAWNINNGSPSSIGIGYNNSLTKQRIDKFIAIYKDNKNDKWTLYPNTVTYAGALAQQSFENYDINASYSVTYVPLDKYPVSSFIGSYFYNEKSILSELIQSVEQISHRVSIVENEKADKDQTPWLYPTLLNGWAALNSDTVVRYRKTSDGLVIVQGLVSGGSSLGQTTVFRLPPGYKPKRTIQPLTYYRDNTGLRPTNLDIYPDGAVKLEGSGIASNNILALIFTFPTEL
ncbi:hypothetical protein [Paenibacillus dauci]|uniref:hypothetical protein n=1 Tax=Paenibacillus dauci TaxID=1567106 RepID=UPI000619F83F|nr:hypothetical protein [Paenibacillus dauci]